MQNCNGEMVVPSPAPLVTAYTVSLQRLAAPGGRRAHAVGDEMPNAAEAPCTAPPWMSAPQEHDFTL